MALLGSRRLVPCSFRVSLGERVGGCPWCRSLWLAECYAVMCHTTGRHAPFELSTPSFHGHRWTTLTSVWAMWKAPHTERRRFFPGCSPIEFPAQPDVGVWNSWVVKGISSLPVRHFPVSGGFHHPGSTWCPDLSRVFITCFVVFVPRLQERKFLFLVKDQDKILSLFCWHTPSHRTVVLLGGRFTCWMISSTNTLNLLNRFWSRDIPPMSGCWSCQSQGVTVNRRLSASMACRSLSILSKGRLEEFFSYATQGREACRVTVCSDWCCDSPFSVWPSTNRHDL